MSSRSYSFLCLWIVSCNLPNELETHLWLTFKAGYSQETARRVASLRHSASLMQDERRVITPPLRTSSANSMGQYRTISMLTTTSVKTDEWPLSDEGKENFPTTSTTQDSQLQKQKQVKWGRSKVRKGHGLRNLFR